MNSPLQKKSLQKSLRQTVQSKQFWLLSLLFAVFFGLFVREYQRVTEQSINSWYEDAHVDCAVVLTGGANRVREGFDLLSRGQAKKLIVSGVYANALLRDIFPLWPLYGKLDEKDVILEKRSNTTYGNAQQTLPLIEALHCRDVALITSNVHMYRAYKTFRGTYPDSIGIVKRAVNVGRGEGSFWEISTEVVKSLFYSLWAY